MIRICKPVVSKSLPYKISQIMDSGILTKGQYVRQAETLIKERTGAKYVTMTSSGTAALHAIMHCAGIDKDSQVFIPSLSWHSAANVAKLLGAEIVFVDCSIDCNSHYMDFYSQYDGYANHKKKQFWIPIHQFGVPVYDILNICQLCEGLGITVIEDCACAYGNSSSGGTHVGNLGLGGIFSFHPRKVITCGEGGAVITNDFDLYVKVDAFVDHGRGIMPGLNYRMSEINACMLVEQLTQYEQIVSDLCHVWKYYFVHLQALNILPTFMGLDNIPQSMIVGPFKNRKKITDALTKEDIEWKEPSVLAHQMEYFECNYKLVNSEWFNAEYMSLPFYTELSSVDIWRICKIIKDNM